MAHSSPQGDDIISGINVTPLVDVTLVVLIIFIVTASVIFRSALPIDLPKAQSAETATMGPLNIGITKGGQILINGRPGGLEKIPGVVADARRRLGPGGKAVSAFVSADVAAQYGTFARVVDRLRIEGVTEIALDTQPGEVRLPRP